MDDKHYILSYCLSIDSASVLTPTTRDYKLKPMELCDEDDEKIIDSLSSDTFFFCAGQRDHPRRVQRDWKLCAANGGDSSVTGTHSTRDNSY